MSKEEKVELIAEYADPKFMTEEQIEAKIKEMKKKAKESVPCISPTASGLECCTVQGGGF